MAFGRLGALGGGFGRLGASGAGGSGPTIITTEQNGVLADFLAGTALVKTAGVPVTSDLDTFFQNGGTSPKLVWNGSSFVWAPHNFVVASEDITGRTLLQCTAPTATFLLPNTANANHQVRTATGSNLPAGSTATHTSIVSAGGYSKIGFFEGGTTGSDVAFNLSGAGSVLFQGAQVPSASITSLGGGQYQCTMTVTLTAASCRVDLYVLPDSYTTGSVTGSWVPDGIKGVNIFRQQTNRGSVLTSYLKTTTLARMGVAVDTAKGGMLAELAATNLLLNNAALSTQSVTVTAVAHTLSFLGTGTVTLSGVSTAGPLVGTGASNRVSLTFTPTAGSLTLTVTGSVTNAQLETGAYATSVVPTSTTSITRAADNYTFLLSTIPALSSAYSLYCRWSCPNVANNLYAMALTGGATANESCGFVANTTARLNVTDGGVSQAAISQGTITADTMLSTAARIKLNDCALSTNGASPAFDTTVTLPTPLEVRFGNNAANGVSTASFCIAKLAIVTDRGWSDAELMAKSAT